MSNRITIEELQSYLWGSATLLRTNIDAGAYKQYIFPLLFFKRICDVYDEETEKALAESDGDIEYAAFPENHTFVVPEGYHWNDVRTVAENVGTAIVNAFRKIESVNTDKLQGIFGDASWTNKNRLPDRLLKDLMEHFSTKTLSIANCPEDELGQGYEYLIKKFADDSGHTAQEFYTNRTVVHLMTELLKPVSGESIYDPTCGSAGMLISSIAYLKQQGKEWRNVQAYGQEINALTSAIGRMNLFLHGVKDFDIINGDTLKAPAFIEKGHLRSFDLILANPPYSISQWDRAAFESDKYGRNQYGVPPQSRADYAFIQHILCSLKPETGRAAILLPHGVLNRNEEKEIRKRIIESDSIDAVIGLGRHLFYNSGLESCILILRMNKPESRKNKVLFIEAEKCIHKVQAQSYLFDEDISRIAEAYFSDADIENFSKHVPTSEILGANDGNLNIKLYVNSSEKVETVDVTDVLDETITNSNLIHAAFAEMIAGQRSEASPFSSCAIDGIEVDRSTWRRVKLSDVAEEYSERVNNPSESEYEWYIGSDCIDGFDFRIPRKDSARKVKSAQKAFKKGDYLLVRRSLYGSDFRERAPRATFDGVCSADILTIREKPEMIADGFLIAVLYSKELWDFIVANSTGSLTRRIKWKQLADYEFLLPPKELQLTWASILWAVYDARESYRAMEKKTDEFVKARFVEMFGEFKTNSMNWPILSFDEFASIDGNMTKDYEKYADYPHIGIDSIEKETGALIGYRTVKEDNVISGKYLFTPEHIIYSKIRPNLNKVALPDFDGLCSADAYPILPNKEVCTRVFLAYVMRSAFFLDYILAFSARSNMPKVNRKEIAGFKSPMPPLALQKEFEDFVHQADKSKFELQRAIVSAETLYKGIIGEIFR